MPMTEWLRARRCSRLLLLGAFCACASKPLLHPGSTDGSAGGSGAGGAAGPSGGTPSQGGAGGDALAPATGSDGGDAFDVRCDLSTLWGLFWLRFNTDQGSLVMTSCGPEREPFIGGLAGQVVFDDNGQLVDDTNYAAGRGGPSKSEWLSMLASYRWPCAAGITVEYLCVSGGD
jgi:hypothetical protein